VQYHAPTNPGKQTLCKPYMNSLKNCRLCLWYHVSTYSNTLS